MQERFQFLGKNPMRVLNKGSFLAAFTITDVEIGIEFRDVRLIQGKNGTFVAAPFRSYEDSQKQTQYVDYWRPAYDFDNKARDGNGVAYVEAMAAVAKEFYDKLVEEGGSPARAGSSGSRSATRGGRGPVAPRGAAKTPFPTVDGNKNESDDLPF